MPIGPPIPMTDVLRDLGIDPHGHGELEETGDLVADR